MKEPSLIDSSVWIAYLFNGLHSDIIDSGEIFLLSSLSVFEIRKKLAKSNIEKNKIEKSIDFVKKRSLVIDVDSKIAENAADISVEKGLPMVDSLIYSTAVINGARLLTLDNDFRGLKGAIIL